jgi:hypothetical protein
MCTIKVCGGEDWLILWERDPGDTLVVIIMYVEPASFH